MGHFPSKEVIRRNHEIELSLNEDRRLQKQTVKLLLLGPAETGKSTILKQMRILHNNGFSVNEIREKTKVVYLTLIKAMLTTIESAVNYQSLSLQCREEVDVLRNALKGAEFITSLTKEQTNALLHLWSEKAVQEAYRSPHTKCGDDGQYFLEQLERICGLQYVPTQFDFLRLRIPTCGLVEMRFELNGLIFRVVDVGGQRSERKKWIHCFENIDAVIFIIALSDYDRLMEEDNRTNRMIDSLMLFEVVVNSRWFTTSSMILFLNKKDLFTQKIAQVPLTVCFPEYEGPENNYAMAVRFIKQKFKDTEQNKAKEIYTHETCATDTNQTQLVLESCIHMITKENAENTGLA